MEGPLTLAEMPPATAELVRELDRFGERGETRSPASMYRHLAPWPGFLALAHALIAPLDQDGRLDELIDHAGRLAGTIATRLAREIAMPPGAPCRLDPRTAAGKSPLHERDAAGRPRHAGGRMSDSICIASESVLSVV